MRNGNVKWSEKKSEKSKNQYVMCFVSISGRFQNLTPCLVICHITLVSPYASRPLSLCLCSSIDVGEAWPSRRDRPCSNWRGKIHPLSTQDNNPLEIWYQIGESHKNMSRTIFTLNSKEKEKRRNYLQLEKKSIFITIFFALWLFVMFALYKHISHTYYYPPNDWAGLFLWVILFFVDSFGIF